MVRLPHSLMVEMMRAGLLYMTCVRASLLLRLKANIYDISAPVMVTHTLLMGLKQLGIRRQMALMKQSDLRTQNKTSFFPKASCFLSSNSWLFLH